MYVINGAGGGRGGGGGGRETIRSWTSIHVETLLINTIAIYPGNSVVSRAMERATSLIV